MNLNHRRDHGRRRLNHGRHRRARSRLRPVPVPANPAAGNRARPPPPYADRRPRLMPTAGHAASRRSRMPASPLRPRLAAALHTGVSM